MDICLNTFGLDTDSDLAAPFRHHHWSDLGKPWFLLCLSHCKYPLLPFVIGRLADPFSFAHLAAVILCPQNHPRIADSIRDLRILSAAIQEYSFTEFNLLQVAVGFDAYV